MMRETEMEIKELLEMVRDGSVTVEEAQTRLAVKPY